MKEIEILVGKGCATKLVCTELGISRATVYRRRSPRHGPPRPHPAPVNRICGQERQQILDTLHETAYVDLSPREIVPKLADLGIYLASIRTFYRVLSESGEIQERRQQARRPKISAPILEAKGPNEVWTWDITRLAGPYQGKWYFLYVMLDLWSRYVVGWMIAEHENARLAQRFIRETVNRHLEPGHDLTVHSDRGSPMTANTTQDMLCKLGVTQSLSRPRTSDDNPFSESAFRTAKYHWTMPPNFPSKEAAMSHFEQFFTWYNVDHMHVGLNLLTPAMVHGGRAEQVVAARQVVWDSAYAKHPERFPNGRTVVKSNPAIVGINLRMKAVKLETESGGQEGNTCAEKAPALH
jgi:putative transposase